MISHLSTAKFPAAKPQKGPVDNLIFDWRFLTFNWGFLTFNWGFLTVIGLKPAWMLALSLLKTIKND